VIVAANVRRTVLFGTILAKTFQPFIPSLILRFFGELCISKTKSIVAELFDVSLRQTTNSMKWNI
jgi:hypothetical protein